MMMMMMMMKRVTGAVQLLVKVQASP